jgi:pSer/pThr/pTyr-binding forkhead associated (FHA) protein
VELSISVRSDETGTLNRAKCSLDTAATLGRGPESPVPLDGTGISREHLRLHLEGAALFITDLSSNGTWLNGRRLTRGKAHPLASSDAIKVPGFEIHLEPQNVPRETIPEPVRAGGPLDSVRAFGASLSKLERFLIALAVATLVLVVLYFMS